MKSSRGRGWGGPHPSRVSPKMTDANLTLELPLTKAFAAQNMFVVLSKIRHRSAHVCSSWFFLLRHILQPSTQSGTYRTDGVFCLDFLRISTETASVQYK